jgi:hypothetical protein
MALKKTSEVISVGFDITESAPNTFTQERIDLQLSALDQEVFVVLAVDLDPAPPDSVTATNTSTEMSLSTVSLTAIGNLNTSQVIANTKLNIETEAAAAPGIGVPFVRTSLDTPQGMIDYIAVIATSDFFIQIEGRNNAAAKNGFGRLWGYRAKMDAAGYAALVQSQVLTN